jgi:GT2 family glycosyltransferase
MINNKTLDTVGWFDENIERAYFEDGDYHLRILLSKNFANKFNKAKFYHYGSRTIKSDERLEKQNKGSYNRNREYLKRKWGIDFHGKGWHPPEEILKEEGIYHHPFNKKSNDWRVCDE